VTTRRDFLYGVAGTLAVGVLVGDTGPATAATTGLSLVATDGYITVPGREGNPLYIFGFVPVNPALTVAQLISTYKGHAQHTAPTLDVKQDDDIKITLTNLGFVQRPDLVDSHTVHWHGFDLPTPLNDGVPRCRSRCRSASSSPTSTGRTARARTCTTATSRTSSTCRWA